MLDNLIEEFRDKIDVKDFFSYLSFEIAKEEILSSKSNIIFLLGKPGSGKSFMLTFLKHNYPQNYILIKDPFVTKEEFFASFPDIDKKTILVDEAQLLNLKMVEFLRVLSDKGNRVIFSMHKGDGQKIASLPQFNSRYIQTITLKPLTFEEFERYTTSKFIKNNKYDIITKKNLKKIYSYTKGNFRLSKRFIFTALNLLDYSLRNSLKYKKIDLCIIEMTAIELGLIR